VHWRFTAVQPTLPPKVRPDWSIRTAFRTRGSKLIV
jgi:hypothetical protein